MVIYADISEFQPPLDSSYPYPAISCRVDNGSRLDNHIGVNWARASIDPNIRVFLGYVVFMPGQLSGVLARVKQVFGQRCPGKLVLRVDMESGAQFAGPGDHSAEANQWVAAFAAYTATAQREDGYANGGDWASQWSGHPATLKRSLADYTDQLPPGWYSYQYYGGIDYPTPPGLPRSCPPFGAWVDLNVTYRTIGQMVSDYGLGAPAPGPTPPTPVTEDDDDMKMISHRGAICLLSSALTLKGIKSTTDVLTYQALGTPGPREITDAEFSTYRLNTLAVQGVDESAGLTVFTDAEVASVTPQTVPVVVPAQPGWVRTYVLDPLERAGSTFVQQFVVILSVSSGVALLASQNWVVAADTAGFAAILSLLTSVLTFGIPKLPPVFDLLLRVLKTFGQSLFGSLTASVVAPSVVHAPWLGALAVAVPVALAALLKGIAALALPQTQGASLLPAA